MDLTESLIEPAEHQDRAPARATSWRHGWFLAAAALTLGNPLLHKAVSDVCDWARARWGFSIYDRIALVGIPLVSALIALLVLRPKRVRMLRSATLASVLVLTLMTLAAQRWLLVANIELIHFPQFALLAAVLLAAGLGGPAAYLGSTAAGVLDEAYQHLVVYQGRSGTYFDINDIVLNAMGAAWAVVLLGDIFRRSDAIAPAGAGSGARVGVASSDGRVAAPRATTDLRQMLGRWLTWPRGAALALFALAITLWLDPPHFSPLLQPTDSGRLMYRVLSTAEGLVACAFLWGMAVFLTRDNKTPGPLGAARAGTATGWSVCLLALVASSACASAPLRAAAVQAPTSAPTPGPVSTAASSSFITTFWCGPPLAEFDDARAAEIAAAGFTIVGPPCEGGSDRDKNRGALDVAARHGLKMWISDGRFNERARTVPNWEALVAAAAADYKDHPAFGGYFVTDEPSAGEFEDLAAIVARLREVDPRGYIYLNLLADYVNFAPGAYRDYVERFVTTVRPSILSYDYYPFRTSGDRPTFFSNLALVREMAQQHDLPFMLILLAMPHGNYRDPTEAELSWQALHALAFGAQGISYFAYWTPVDVAFADMWKFRHGLIENGKPTEHYFEAMRLNQVARAIAEQLASFRSVSVGDSMGEVAAPLPIGPIASIEGGPVTAGFFADAAGQRAALLVNRDYRRAVTVRLRLVASERLPQRFSTETGVWTDDADATLRLAPGGAQLVRWPSRE